MPEQEFHHPEPSSTPDHRRKLLILSILGVLVIVLLWIATFPFNYGGKSDEASAPSELVNVISNDIGTSAEAIANAQPDNENNTSNETPADTNQINDNTSN